MPNFALPARELSTIFPFHFVVDEQERVRQVGPQLTVLAPRLQLGDPMQLHFRIVRPEGARPPVDGHAHERVLHLLRSVEGGPILRGEWVPVEGGAMFVGSPWVTDLAQLRREGLTLGSFAVHDPVADYLVLLQTLQTSLADSERLQQELQRHRASLQQQVEARTRELARQTELLQAVFEDIPVMLVVLDTAGEVQLVNRELEQALGWSLEQWQGGGVLEQIVPDPAERRILTAADDDARGVWRDLTVRTQDGQTLETSWCTESFTGGSIWIGRDITARRQAQRLQQRVQQAEHLAGIGQLAAGIAHEINNPATYVLANLELLEEQLGDLAAAPDEPASRVGASTSVSIAELQQLRQLGAECLDGMIRVRRIVRDLSTFSRVSHGEIERVDLREVIETACRLTANEVRHRAQLVKQLGEIPPIVADRGKLVQLLVNLLVNAAHAIETGHASDNSVTVATEADDDHVILRVSDSGAGIEPQLVPRVFEPFFTTKARGAGTGLGLSLCAQIVRMHGGVITIDSEVGEGTTIEVTFPRDTGLRTVPAAMVETKAATPPTRGRVLIVDDEPLVLESCRRVLQSEHEVVLARSGREALELVFADEAEPFDVILCDLMMPEIDGVGVYEQLRQRAPSLVERVVFFSGGAFTPEARELAASVANPVLEKPVSVQTLRRVVAELCRGGRAR